MTLNSEVHTDGTTVFLKCEADINEVTLFHQSNPDSYSMCRGKQ